MKRFFTADMHFNHANICIYADRPLIKPGDLDVDGKWVSGEVALQRSLDMNKMLIREANNKVKPEDNVIHVGDFANYGGNRGVEGLRKKPIDFLKELNGTWFLIEGNHDRNNRVKTLGRFLECKIGTYNVGVQHKPLQEPTTKKLKYHLDYCRHALDFIICGHIHNNWKVKKLFEVWHINVGVDVHKYRPIDDSGLLAIFENIKRDYADDDYGNSIGSLTKT